MSENITTQENQSETTKTTEKLITPTLIITSIICVLPMIFGFIVWNRLPDQIPIHWGFNGEPNRMASKLFGVVCPPLLCLMLNIYINLLVSIKKKHNTFKGKQMESILRWFIPVVDLILSAMTYMICFGINLNVIKIAALILSAVLILTGNYLPKSSGSSNLKSEKMAKLDEITKRPMGYMMVILGFVNLICAFFSFEKWVLLATVVTSIIGPIVMYAIADKKLKEE